MTSQDTLTVAEYRHKISEHQLQVQVLDYIEQEKATPDIYVIAIPNGGRRSISVAKKLKREGLRAGVADLEILMPQGRVAWLELKTKNGRQSPEQKIFAGRCERLGHPYAVAKTFDEAVMFLKYVGALR
jgi:VRR-NUC domain